MPSTDDNLTARIAELEAENEQLRADQQRADKRQAASALPRPHPGRAALSAAVIIVGLVLGTISVGASYAKNQLTDTELFVATFAPLANDPAVQAVVIDAVTDAVEESVDIPAITSSLFDELGKLGLSPRAQSALGLLQGPINQGMKSLVEKFVTDFVESAAFSDIWATTVRSTHTQLLATMQNAPGSAVTISANGSLELQLGPIISEVRSRLIANDVRIAEAIPAVDRSIVIVQDASLGSLTTIYALTVAIGSWLPWVALALLTAGVLLANRRRKALITTAIAAAILMGLLGIALAIGRTVVVGMLSGAAVTPAAGTVIYNAATESAASTVLALGVLAIVLVATAWMSGPSRVPERLRKSISQVASASRHAGDRHGISSGATGRWVERHHTLVITAIGAISAAVILLARPLTMSTVILTVVVAALVLLLVQFMRRPEPGEAAEEPEA